MSFSLCVGIFLQPNYAKHNGAWAVFLHVGDREFEKLGKQLNKQRFGSPLVNGEAPLKLAFPEKCHIYNAIRATDGLIY